MRCKFRGADIRSRLHGTVIRYRNEPYYVSVDGEMLILNDIVTRKKVKTVSADDPYLDVSSLDLGYVNIEYPTKCAVYVMRHPQRRYKQGVDFTTVSIKPLAGDRGLFSYECLFCQGFVDSYHGKFPSWKDAMSILVDKKAESVAISNTVAIRADGKNFKVYLRETEEGYGELGSNLVKIPFKELSWITEVQLGFIPDLQVKVIK